MIRLATTALVALALAGPAAARPDPTDQFRTIEAKEPVRLRPDRAYVLLRIDVDVWKFSAAIMRVPDAAELAAYEAARKVAYAKAGAKAGPLESFSFEYGGTPNFFTLQPGKAIASAGKIRTVLAEVRPGSYVLYGLGMGNYLHECFCLGTVGFAAEADKVTDLGTLLIAKAWEPSPLPELKDEVDLGKSAVMDFGLFAVGIRPAPRDAVPPAGVEAGAVVPADYRAIGAFVEPNTLLVNRLAALPGVLAYDQGHVVDARTGQRLD